MENLDTVVAQVAARRASGVDVLPQLAIAVLRAAQQGHVGVDDANDLYLDYIRKAHPRRKIEADEPGVRANTSKMRQFIKLGHERDDGEELLRRVAERREELMQRRDVRPLYFCFVLAARKQLEQKRALSNQTLDEVILKE